MKVKFMSKEELEKELKVLNITATEIKMFLNRYYFFPKISTPEEIEEFSERYNEICEEIDAITYILEA